MEDYHALNGRTSSVVRTSPVYLVGIPPTEPLSTNANRHNSVRLTVVVYSGQHWDRFFGDIDTREDSGSL